MHNFNLQVTYGPYDMASELQFRASRCVRCSGAPLVDVRLSPLVHRGGEASR